MVEQSKKRLEKNPTSGYDQTSLIIIFLAISCTRIIYRLYNKISIKITKPLSSNNILFLFSLRAVSIKLSLLKLSMSSTTTPPQIIRARLKKTAGFHERGSTRLRAAPSGAPISPVLFNQNMTRKVEGSSHWSPVRLNFMTFTPFGEYLLPP